MDNATRRNTRTLPARRVNHDRAVERTAGGLHEVRRGDRWFCAEPGPNGRPCGAHNGEQPCRHRIAAVLTLDLHHRLAHLRAWRGWNQEQCAAYLGKSQSWLDKVERDQRRIDRIHLLEDIAAVLRVDPILLILPTGHAATWTPAITELCAAGGTR